MGSLALHIVHCTESVVYSLDDVAAWQSQLPESTVKRYCALLAPEKINIQNLLNSKAENQVRHHLHMNS